MHLRATILDRTNTCKILAKHGNTHQLGPHRSFSSEKLENVHCAASPLLGSAVQEYYPLQSAALEKSLCNHLVSPIYELFENPGEEEQDQQGGPMFSLRELLYCILVEKNPY